jgi:hypothetical protein
MSCIRHYPRLPFPQGRQGRLTADTPRESARPHTSIPQPQDKVCERRGLNVRYRTYLTSINAMWRSRSLTVEILGVQEVTATRGSEDGKGSEESPRPLDPRGFLAKVGEGRRIVQCRKGDIVYSQGDPADAVFFVQRGKVRVTAVSEQGKEAVVAIPGAGDFFGEGCLARQNYRLATAATADRLRYRTHGKGGYSPSPP